MIPIGANEKHAATYHGGEYTPTLDDLRDLWVDHKLDPLPRAQSIELVPTVQAEFDRWLAKVRAEAKAEALTEMAKELENQLAGLTRETGQTRSGRDIIRRIRNRANQYKENQ